MENVSKWLMAEDDLDFSLFETLSKERERLGYGSLDFLFQYYRWPWLSTRCQPSSDRERGSRNLFKPHYQARS